MKLDLTKLPIAEGIIGFLIIMLGITFYFAFKATDDGGREAVAESPTPAESPFPDGSPSPGGAIAVTLRDNSFEEDELTVQAGASVTFDITNDGSAIHNMHIAGPDGDYTEDFCEGGADPCSDPNSIRGGQTATLTWEVPPSPGDVDFRCDFHPVEMTGTITIQ